MQTSGRYTFGRFAAALTLAACAASSDAFFGRAEFESDPAQTFSAQDVTRGVHATREQCEATAGAVWAEVDDAGECLRYWTAGFGAQGRAARALVFFSGDLLTVRGMGWKQYEQHSPRSIQKMADSVARRYGVPYVFLARPGVMGSSGDHRQRRRPLESRLVSAAMDALAARHGIREWTVAGLSGGGHVAASLLTLRRDIACAALASAVSAPRLRWQAAGHDRDLTGYSDSYEPMEHLDRAAMHPALRVYVLGDPRDTRVPMAAQRPFAERLRSLGVPTTVLAAEAKDKEHHEIGHSAIRVGALCLQGVTTAQMSAEFGKPGRALRN